MERPPSVSAIPRVSVSPGLTRKEDFAKGNLLFQDFLQPWPRPILWNPYKGRARLLIAPELAPRPSVLGGLSFSFQVTSGEAYLPTRVLSHAPSACFKCS
jgi:hypothetical protein